MSGGRELTPVRPRESRRRDGSVTTSYTFRYRDVLGRKRRVTLGPDSHSHNRV